mmetsp:Transcript_5210/g.11549  ORF Transcript_5210/g.11549 Transcript_5210/m.11549 type:complete len:509 (-) Transcript_5210:3772-5298(-)
MHVSWHPGGSELASASIDGRVLIWKIGEGSAVKQLEQEGIKGLAWDPKGRYLLAQAESAAVIWDSFRWNDEPYKLCKCFARSMENLVVSRPDWSPDGSSFCVVHTSGHSPMPTSTIIRRGEFSDTHNEFATFAGFNHPVTCARFSPVIHRNWQSQSGYLVALGSVRGHLSIWLSSQERPVAVLKKSCGGTIYDVAWSKDGKMLACCSDEGDVSLVCLDEAFEGLEIESSNYSVVSQPAKAPQPSNCSASHIHELFAIGGDNRIQNYQGHDSYVQEVHQSGLSFKWTSSQLVCTVAGALEWRRHFNGIISVVFLQNLDVLLVVLKSGGALLLSAQCGLLTGEPISAGIECVNVETFFLDNNDDLAAVISLSDLQNRTIVLAVLSSGMFFPFGGKLRSNDSKLFGISHADKHKIVYICENLSLCEVHLAAALLPFVLDSQSPSLEIENILFVKQRSRDYDKLVSALITCGEGGCIAAAVLRCSRIRWEWQKEFSEHCSLLDFSKLGLGFD